MPQLLQRTAIKSATHISADALRSVGPDGQNVLSHELSVEFAKFALKVFESAWQVSKQAAAC